MFIMLFAVRMYLFIGMLHEKGLVLTLASAICSYRLEYSVWSRIAKAVESNLLQSITA